MCDEQHLSGHAISIASANLLWARLPIALFPGKPAPSGDFKKPDKT
jgi:hypothetical protein